MAGAAPVPPVDDGALDLVPALEQLVLEVRDECSEVRRIRAGIHLGDEEDAHA
jgi:hypothetical protein